MEIEDYKFSYFIWLALTDRLPTNSLRHSWGMDRKKWCMQAVSERDGNCNTCAKRLPCIKGYLELIEVRFTGHFFSLPLSQGVAERAYESKDGYWKTLFVVTCWRIWTRRCRVVFNEDVDEEKDGGLL